MCRGLWEEEEERDGWVGVGVEWQLKVSIGGALVGGMDTVGGFKRSMKMGLLISLNCYIFSFSSDYPNNHSLSSSKSVP
jgi:hypothetical protein